MDTKKYAESDYINVDLIKNSPTKKLVIVGEITEVETDFGMRLNIEVELDKIKKHYRPNKDTLKNIHNGYGTESDDWMGMVIKCQIVMMRGKETVLGVPEMVD